MNNIFHISKLLIKKKLKVLTASNKLELKRLYKVYPFVKDIKIKELVNKIDDYSAINKEKAWKDIEHKFQNKKEKSIFTMYYKTWYKYAATVLLISVLTTVYFYRDNSLNSSVNKLPIIVNTNTVNPGTDKATLTLEDGSVVELNKGNTFQTQNISSNGEEIIYREGKSNSREVAYNYLTIPRGGQFFIKLSDGTQVWLNSESQFKYPIKFVDGETRQVELVYGEAYFDVSPSSENEGSKFKVFNQSQEVEVLGTEFNLKAYKDEFSIQTTLVEGKVIVGNGTSKQNLIPNQQANLNLKNNSYTISKVDVKDEISWRNSIFSFSKKPLKEIMKTISRWYDIDVVFKNKDLEKITFSGVLGKNQNMEEILLTLKTLSTIKDYNIIDNTIILE